MAKENLRVVMLPWSAFGHIMPYFQLSIAMAETNVHVYFISTPKNIQRLPKVPADLDPFIHLVSIPFPPLDADFLPAGAEATVDLPFEKIDNLRAAYDLLQHPIKKFIGELLPDWLFSDFAAGTWVVDIAKEFGVPLGYFSPFSAASSVFFGSPENLLGTNRDYALPTPESLTTPPDWITFPSLVAFKDYEAVYVPEGFFGTHNGTKVSGAATLAKLLLGSQVLAIRTCDEVEGEYLDVYRKITGKPVFATGLLPPEQPPKRAKGKISTTDDDGIFGWLDKQKPKSVVFVGFGSECKLSKEQVYEIAHGLELSKLPFLWALRKPGWADSDSDALPPSFVERTSEKGLVSFGWVPQFEILGHSSIGGSLFHSGWGSVIETLQFGHVLVLLPLIIDQPLNARLLVEKGLAVEVKRHGDGSFSKDEIAKTLTLAIVEEEGEQLRSNAKKAAQVFGDHKLHQDHYIAGFVDFLKNHVTKSSS